MDKIARVGQLCPPPPKVTRVKRETFICFSYDFLFFFNLIKSAFKALGWNVSSFIGCLFQILKKTDKKRQYKNQMVCCKKQTLTKYIF